MINGHEYFSVFSRDNRVFQSPEASNIHFGRQALLTSCSASPSPTVQRKGHLIIHGRTFWYIPCSSPQPLLSFLGPSAHPWLPFLRCPVVPLCRADPQPVPALWYPASLRSRRLALGTHTRLLTQPEVQTCSGNFGWVLQYSKEIICGGLCMYGYNLWITVHFNLLPNLTLHYIS